MEASKIKENLRPEIASKKSSRTNKNSSVIEMNPLRIQMEQCQMFCSFVTVLIKHCELYELYDGPHRNIR